MFHEGPPNLGGEVAGGVVADRPAQHGAREVRLAGVVVEPCARFRGPGQPGQVIDQRHAVEAPGQGDIGGWIRVALVPGRAGSHLQEIPNRRAVVGTTPEAGQVVRYVLVDAVDVAVPDRRADEQRRHRFRNRERHPARCLAVP